MSELEQDGWSEPLAIVDDENADTAPPVDEERPYVCEHCDKTYTSQGGLRAHLLTKHPGAAVTTKRKKKEGGSEAAPRRGRNAGGSGSRQERRRKMVRETIDELTEVAVELRQGTGTEPGRLADVLRRDADRIATSLSWIAERVNPLGSLIDVTMGHGGAITIARGFNGVGLWFLRTWRKALAGRAAERKQEAFYLDEREGDGDYTAPEDPGAGDGSLGSEGPVV